MDPLNEFLETGKLSFVDDDDAYSDEEDDIYQPTRIMMNHGLTGPPLVLNAVAKAIRPPKRDVPWWMQKHHWAIAAGSSAMTIAVQQLYNIFNNRGAADATLPELPAPDLDALPPPGEYGEYNVKTESSNAELPPPGEYNVGRSASLPGAMLALDPPPERPEPTEKEQRMLSDLHARLSKIPGPYDSPQAPDYGAMNRKMSEIDREHEENYQRHRAEIKEAVRLARLEHEETKNKSSFNPPPGWEEGETFVFGEPAYKTGTSIPESKPVLAIGWPYEMGADNRRGPRNKKIDSHQERIAAPHGTSQSQRIKYRSSYRNSQVERLAQLVMHPGGDPRLMARYNSSKAPSMQIVSKRKRKRKPSKKDFKKKREKK